MAGGSARPVVGAMAKLAGGRPVSTAMECSSWARCSATAIDWAWVDFSWVSACITSAFDATPAAYWLRVICNERV